MHYLPAKVPLAIAAFLIATGLSAQVKLPDNLLATLNSQHPRLLVKDLTAFDRIKQRIATDTFLIRCRNNVLQEAGSIIGEPVCTYDIPDGLRLLVMSRKVLLRTYVLSMAYRLTANKKYAERLWADLLAASQFPDWNPRHFLDVAEMTHAFAIGYDWLFDVWSEQQKQVIRQTLIEKGLLRGLAYYNRLVPPNRLTVDFPRTSSNWNSVCNSGMSIGALAVANEEPLLAAQLLTHAINSIPLALKAYAPDGGFNEGPSYWGYAMRYNVVMMAALESALGTDFGLSNTAGFSATGNFPIAMSGTTGKPYQYSDAWPTIVNEPVYWWLANRFSNPQYGNYVQGISEASVRDLLWYTRQSASADLPLDNFFTKVNVASLRSAWHDSTAWFVGIKGGYNQDSHSHLDLGSFIIEKSAIRWFVDLGVDSYNLKGYFDNNKQRWTYYRVRAEGHNTLVINPDTLPDQELAAGAKITKFISGKNKSYASIDLSEAYKGKVISAKRGIALIAKNEVLVQDEIVADKPFELFWFAHTPAGVQIMERGKLALLKIGDKKLVAEIISPAAAVFEVIPAQLLATSIQSLGNNKNEGIQKLAIHLKGAANTTIAIRFSEDRISAKTVIMPVEKW